MGRRGVCEADGGELIRKGIKIAGLILTGGLIVMQFVQPEQNRFEGSPEHDMLTSLSAPVHLAALLKNSCYDCHSENSRYPWYSKISPVSWYLSGHIQRGKEAVNFSNFNQLDPRKKISVLSGICEVVESGTMPLPSFLIIHGDAGLDEDEMETICHWSESESMRIMNSDRDP
ncbi:MAG: heme-binding domain-containing protein [Bacteroidetes bacterium]|nr:heme-binding domain-containing protein [Bacteroidota bacterium]